MTAIWDPITNSWFDLPVTRQAKVAERRREEARQVQIQYALTPEGRLAEYERKEEERRRKERERKARYRARQRGLPPSVEDYRAYERERKARWRAAQRLKEA